MERLFEQTDLKTPNVNCSDREEHFSLGKSIFDELHKVGIYECVPSFHELQITISIIYVRLIWHTT